MSKKPDPTQIITLYLRTFGGEVAGASALAPKVGPLGLSARKIGEDLAKATMGYKGLRVTCKLTIQNRQATIEVVPSTASLLIKALNEPERDRKKVKNITHSGNLTIEQIFDVARAMRSASLAKRYEGTVMEVLGTAQSLGCTVEGDEPRAVQAQIRDGSLQIPEEE